MGNSYDIVLTGTAPARMTSPCHLRAFAIGVATIHTNNIPAQIPGRVGPTVKELTSSEDERGCTGRE